MKVETDSIASTVKHVPVYKKMYQGHSKMQGNQKTCPLYELLPFILFRLKLDVLFMIMTVCETKFTPVRLSVCPS